MIPPTIGEWTLYIVLVGIDSPPNLQQLETFSVPRRDYMAYSHRWLRFHTQTWGFRGGFQDFWFSTRSLRKWCNLTSIFLRWVVQPPNMENPCHFKSTFGSYREFAEDNLQLMEDSEEFLGKKTYDLQQENPIFVWEKQQTCLPFGKWCPKCWRIHFEIIVIVKVETAP